MIIQHYSANLGRAFYKKTASGTPIFSAFFDFNHIYNLRFYLPTNGQYFSYIHPELTALIENCPIIYPYIDWLLENVEDEKLATCLHALCKLID